MTPSTGRKPSCRRPAAPRTVASSRRTGAQVVELGVINATIHKVNECVRVADIDALSKMYEQSDGGSCCQA